MKDMTPKDVESLQMKELEKRRLVRLFNAGCRENLVFVVLLCIIHKQTWYTQETRATCSQNRCPPVRRYSTCRYPERKSSCVYSCTHVVLSHMIIYVLKNKQKQNEEMKQTDTDADQVLERNVKSFADLIVRSTGVETIADDIHRLQLTAVICFEFFRHLLHAITPIFSYLILFLWAEIIFNVNHHETAQPRAKHQRGAISKGGQGIPFRRRGSLGIGCPSSFHITCNAHVHVFSSGTTASVRLGRALGLMARGVAGGSRAARIYRTTKFWRSQIVRTKRLCAPGTRISLSEWANTRAFSFQNAQ